MCCEKSVHAFLIVVRLPGCTWRCTLRRCQSRLFIKIFDIIIREGPDPQTTIAQRLSRVSESTGSSLVSSKLLAEVVANVLFRVMITHSAGDR
jgi:hypothetical protein